MAPIKRVVEVEQRLFSFGIIADVQHADKDDRLCEGRWVRCREASRKLATSVDHFNSIKHSLSFVLTLGDIIDGNSTMEKTEADFEVIMNELSKLQFDRVFHALGNHCLSMPREVLYDRLRLPKASPYYTAEVYPGWQLVVLDTQDLSLLWPAGSEKYVEGKKYWEARPLSEVHPQMSSWNGGVGVEQLEWLRQVLSDAESNNRRVLIAAHHPLVGGSARPTHVIWNCDEVLAAVLTSPAVVAYFAGHYHPGGYQESEGKHFVTIEGVVEAPQDITAHATIDVFANRLVINGHGSATSRVLQYI